MPTGETAARYLRFANLEAHGSSPLYEKWASGVAQDPEIIELLDSLPTQKRQPNLAFAAARVHGAAELSYAEFREHFVSRWLAIRATMLASSTQTNEAARTSTLLPWLASIERPIALLEVGASAGLCLYPDRYSHIYSDGVRTVRVDPNDGPSEVELRCHVDRIDRVPVTMPHVQWRAGIDLKPIDVRDPDAMAWLRMLVWPEHHERRQRLAAAAKLVGHDAPRLIAGDLLECLADTAAGAPRDAQLVVFHSAVLNYLTVEERAAFMTAVRQLDAVWLANEGDGVLPWKAPAGRAREGAHFVVARNGVPVALASGHGQWLEWL